MTKKFKTPRLHNLIDKKVLKKILQKDKRLRTTLSFYNYYPITPETYLHQVRDELYQKLGILEVLGRIYLAKEGINAQISVLNDRMSDFQTLISGYSFLGDVPLNESVEENPERFSFYKLIVRIRSRIVADGLSRRLKFTSDQKATPLTPEKFHRVLEEGGLPVDVRNHYESEIGHFRNAFTVDADTFRQQLPMLANDLKKYRESKLLLYCTGGIRCEKAGAYLKQKGYSQVYQLKGGIIAYAKYVKKHKLNSYFIGKNFVFDGRMGERITDDVIANCHQCGEPCDGHTNCQNDACHLLFIQCKDCQEKFKGCCSEECQKIIYLPVEKQRKIRRGRKNDSSSVYKSRIRPRLNLELQSRKVLINR